MRLKLKRIIIDHQYPGYHPRDPIVPLDRRTNLSLGDPARISHTAASGLARELAPCFAAEMEAAYEQLRQFALGFPEAHEEFPWGECAASQAADR